jgi:hypothetical protein
MKIFGIPKREDRGPQKTHSPMKRGQAGDLAMAQAQGGAKPLGNGLVNHPVFSSKWVMRFLDVQMRDGAERERMRELREVKLHASGGKPPFPTSNLMKS